MGASTGSRCCFVSFRCACVACRWRRKRVPKWRRSGSLPMGAVRSESFPLLRSVVRNGPEPSRRIRSWANKEPRPASEPSGLLAGEASSNRKNGSPQSRLRNRRKQIVGRIRVVFRPSCEFEVGVESDKQWWRLPKQILLGPILELLGKPKQIVLQTIQKPPVRIWPAVEEHG